MYSRILFLFGLGATLLGAGCSIVHTVPLAARLGDTVMISVGSPDDMTQANITSITYTPTNGSPITIPTSNIRSVFNLYPDKTSAAWLYSDADLIENNSGHGPWTTVIALDLPNDGSLPVGTGDLEVNTTAVYHNPVPGINGQPTSLEILPASATSPNPSSFNYRGIGQVELTGDLSQLTRMPRLEFKPAWTGYDNSHTYGAVEIKIGIDKTGIAEDDFNVIVDDKIGPTQVRNVSAISNAKRFETTVYFISYTGELQYSDVDFSIISKSLQNQFVNGDQHVATDVTINSVTWYDIDGKVDTAGPPIDIINLTGT